MAIPPVSPANWPSLKKKGTGYDANYPAYSIPVVSTRRDGRSWSGCPAGFMASIGTLGVPQLPGPAHLAAACRHFEPLPLRHQAKTALTGRTQRSADVDPLAIALGPLHPAV